MLQTQNKNWVRPILTALNRTRFLDLYRFFKDQVISEAVILSYHSIGPSSTNIILDSVETIEFEKQVKYLSETYNVIHLDDLATKIVNKESIAKCAVITFDDGYKNVFKYAYPILCKYRVPATIFLTTGHIETGVPFWWDKLEYILLNATEEKMELPRSNNSQLTLLLDTEEARIRTIRDVVQFMKRIPEEQKQKLIKQIQKKTMVEIPNEQFKDLVLSWTEISEMNKTNIRFGSHTVTHPILTQIPLTQAIAEILDSKKELERKLGQPITTFAYPNGQKEDFNPEIMEILAQNGFTCAVTTIQGMVDTNTNTYMMKRVGPGWNFDAFRFVLSGLYYRR